MTDMPRRASAAAPLEKWHGSSRVSARRPVVFDTSWTDIVNTLKSKLLVDAGLNGHHVEHALRPPRLDANQRCSPQGGAADDVVVGRQMPVESATVCEPPQPAACKQPSHTATFSRGAIARLHTSSLSALVARSARASKPRPFQLTLTLPAPPPPPLPPSPPPPAALVSPAQQQARRVTQSDPDPAALQAQGDAEGASVPPAIQPDDVPSGAAAAAPSPPSVQLGQHPCDGGALWLAGAAAAASGRRGSSSGMLGHMPSPAARLLLSSHVSLSLARTPIEGVPERVSFRGASASLTPAAAPPAAQSLSCSLAATPIEGIPEMSLRLPRRTDRRPAAAPAHVATVPPTPLEGVPERAAPYFTPGFALRQQAALAAAAVHPPQCLQTPSPGANDVAEASGQDATAGAPGSEPLEEMDDQPGELMDAVLGGLPLLADEMSTNDAPAGHQLAGHLPAAAHQLAGLLPPAPVTAAAVGAAVAGTASRQAAAPAQEVPAVRAVTPPGAAPLISPLLPLVASRLAQQGGCDAGQQFPSPPVTEASRRQDVGRAPGSTLAGLAAVSSGCLSGASVGVSQRAGPSSAPGLAIMSAGAPVAGAIPPLGSAVTDGARPTAGDASPLGGAAAAGDLAQPLPDPAQLSGEAWDDYGHGGPSSDDDGGGDYGGDDDDGAAAGPAGLPGADAGPSTLGAAAQAVEEARGDEEEEGRDEGAAGVTLRPRPHRCSDANVRERDLYRKRKSLAGGGLITDEDLGVRRSSRQHQRPLEYWRNEHKRYGRQHQSLPTVVSVATLTPDPQWPAPSDKAHHKRTRARTMQ